jgi:cytochrome oxidase Cu insertion factor (SCO1/SenC/PrrC family)
MGTVRWSAPFVATLCALLMGCLAWKDAMPKFDLIPREAQVALGAPAPEIEGEDLDGQPLQLSDNQGQVVLLDFWGNW